MLMLNDYELGEQKPNVPFFLFELQKIMELPGFRVLMMPVSAGRTFTTLKGETVSMMD